MIEEMQWVYVVLAIDEEGCDVVLGVCKTGETAKQLVQRYLADQQYCDLWIERRLLH